jgi:hypothetical protein
MGSKTISLETMISVNKPYGKLKALQSINDKSFAGLLKFSY